MTHKLKIILISGVGALLVLAVALWFLVLQPNQLKNASQAEELLTSGINLFNDKKYDETLEILARIPSGTTQEAKVRYYQGSTYIMLKDFDSAVDYLGQAHKLNSDDIGVLYALGVAYFKLGKIKLAKSYFASVLEINPQDEQAKGLLNAMAKLERRSATTPESESNKNDLPSTPYSKESSGN